ncbi:hypothetical protein CRG98_036788 [Punica granatum]|uniref:Uncharacterized protein n=1 Tax=Punica granatum TaxID=22663 RepID=A0A2I0IFQ1_PUNGR|nr:hypothetical protein CRG98_036788 [Punica granatum]
MNCYITGDVVWGEGDIRHWDRCADKPATRTFANWVGENVMGRHSGPSPTCQSWGGLVRRVSVLVSLDARTGIKLLAHDINHNERTLYPLKKHVDINPYTSSYGEMVMVPADVAVRDRIQNLFRHPQPQVGFSRPSSTACFVLDLIMDRAFDRYTLMINPGV